MENHDLIQVLWVEDDPKIIYSYPQKAESFGLELVSFPCWDNAREALESDYDRWSAIILDAKCKYHRGDTDNAVKFLAAALKDIAVISKEKQRVIPWYVLTGGAESEVSDSITDDRMKWDADWTTDTNKNYYSKNVDNEMLFKRIRYFAKKSPRMQIQEMYRDSCELLDQLDTNACEDIMTILEAIHFPDSHPDFTPRLFYNPLRKALEYIFRDMRKVSIIPDNFFNGNTVNINQCFMFVIGKDAEKLGFKHKDGGITPRHIQDMMSLIINLGNANSHSFETSHYTELSEEEIQNYDKHIKTIGGNSKLMIFSIALQFCEILQWMNNYINNHPDKEENRKKWVKLDGTENTLENKDDCLGIVEVHNGIYHIGDKYLLNSKTIEQHGWLGKKVRIIKKDKNKSPSAKQYPFFAFLIEPVE
ncbi:MAG: hypothetical protein CW341_10320 [Bacteroidetes bacterium]|nr:hypothetical protein [Bacteroidota bacterium]